MADADARPGGLAPAKQQLSDDLTCPICLEWFTAAVETSCGHAFCCDCLLKVVSSSSGEADDPSSPGGSGTRCPTCRSPLDDDVRHACTLQRAVTAARLAAEAPAAAAQGSSGEGLRQRRGAASAADAAAEPVALAAAADSHRDTSRELATAMHRLALRRGSGGGGEDGGGGRRSWTFHRRTMCCVDIRCTTQPLVPDPSTVSVQSTWLTHTHCVPFRCGRVLVALVCAMTVAINVLLYRMQAGAATSNIFSMFAYTVGLLAVGFEDGDTTFAFLCYAAADTLFAIAPVRLSPDNCFQNRTSQ